MGGITRRKSPFKHKVREHTRAGRPVQRYVRGKGKKPRQLTKHNKSRVVGQTRAKSVIGDLGFRNFDVDIEYLQGSSERFTVRSPNYPSALNSGMSRRKSIDDPKKIWIKGVP